MLRWSTGLKRCTAGETGRGKLPPHVQRIVDTGEAFRGSAAEVATVARHKGRGHASRAVLPSSMVGDCVSVARVTQGVHIKLVSIWTGLWREVNDDKDHLYIVQNTVAWKTTVDVHVVHIIFIVMQSYLQQAVCIACSNIWSIKPINTFENV